MANFISLLGLISKNGVYATTSNSTAPNPTLIDITSDKIAYVSVVSARLQNGTTANAFEIVCSNLKGYEPDVYLLKVDPTHCPTIDAFYTGLSTITSNAAFTKYTSLLAIEGVSVASKSVIISERFQKNRQYIPSRGTLVFVDIVNAYKAKEFLFSGDQTVAGNYTYFPS